MRWLTTEWIKAHSRVDFDGEDALLELYGESAEETVLNLLNRTYENLVATYGEVPKGIVQASLMLVELSYQQRGPVTQQELRAVPYGFDLLVKPYMVLSSGGESDPVNAASNRPLTAEEMDLTLTGELPTYLTDSEGRAVLDENGEAIEII